MKDGPVLKSTGRIEGDGLAYPFAQPAATGELMEVAPGILWTRIPLPFRLNPVNIYLIEDGDGWAVLDTGISNRATREVWEAMTAGPLAGRRLTRLIVSHFHPDHIGLAGWLCERHSMPLLTSQTCYLGCINISLSPNSMGDKPYQDFYRSHGMSGDGHAAEQLMLYLREENVFLAADQVLAKITPNVSVWAVDPFGDPLGLYLRSLRQIETVIPHDALVLPGHQLPFRGVDIRARQLAAHHEERCEILASACAEGAKSVAELVPALFPRALDPHQLSFAFSETHAHVNYMVGRGELAWEAPSADLMRVRGVG